MIFNLKPNRQKGRQHGFTLMELMITIAIVAISLGLAIPSFRSVLQNGRLTGQSSELITAMQFARSEALKRGFPVELCSSDDGVDCGGNWNQGWLVYAELPGGDEVLRVWPGSGSDFIITEVNGLSEVRYQPTGFAVVPPGLTAPDLDPLQLDLSLPDCGGNNARQITVKATGRAASERTPCS